MLAFQAFFINTDNSTKWFIRMISDEHWSNHAKHWLCFTKINYTCDDPLWSISVGVWTSCLCASVCYRSSCARIENTGVWSVLPVINSESWMFFCGCRQSRLFSWSQAMIWIELTTFCLVKWAKINIYFLSALVFLFVVTTNTVCGQNKWIID